MRKRPVLALVGLAAVVSFCGCPKSKEDYTLNPDGSGKMTCEQQGVEPDFADFDRPLPPNEEARRRARDLVADSKGVTAWKDVTFSAEKDGRIRTKGTAYFKDIAKFKRAGEQTIRCKPVADGAIQLELVLGIPQDIAPAVPPKLTEEEIKQKIAEHKAQFNKNLPLITQHNKDLRLEWSFTLPGVPEKMVNFEKVADRPNTVRVVIEGAKVLEAEKAFWNDDAYLRTRIVAGKNPDGWPEPELLNEKLFGTKGPITVTFKPGDKPLFDWAAESEAAKKTMPELMKSLEGPTTPAAK